MTVSAYLMDGKDELMQLTCVSAVDLSNLVVWATSLHSHKVEQGDVLDAFHNRKLSFSIPTSFFKRTKLKWVFSYNED